MPAVPEGHYPHYTNPDDRKPVSTVFLPGDPRYGRFYPIGPDNNWACDNDVCAHDMCHPGKRKRISDLILELMREHGAEPLL